MQIVIIVVDTVISIHALLAESDFMFSVVFYLENIFLSTLSLRRATTCGGGWNEQPRYFYPRSPCGERPPRVLRHCTTYLFLSTLSLRRATSGCVRYCIHARAFLSTLSLRRATPAPGAEESGIIISIHALLAESDIVGGAGNNAIRISIHALLAESDKSDTATAFPLSKAFLSTLSLRRATYPPVKPFKIGKFLSTLSLRRATLQPGYLSLIHSISIHTLLAESDVNIRSHRNNRSRNFYPHSPCGERPWQRGSRITYVEFLSTLSLRRATGS